MCHSQMHIHNSHFCLLAAVGDLGAKPYSAFSVFRTIGWNKHMMNHWQYPSLRSAWPALTSDAHLASALIIRPPAIRYKPRLTPYSCLFDYSLALSEYKLQSNNVNNSLQARI